MPIQNVQFRGGTVRPGVMPMRGNVAVRAPMRGAPMRGAPMRGIVRGALRPGMPIRRPMVRPGEL